jgi:hypothetical protein
MTDHNSNNSGGGGGGGGNSGMAFIIGGVVVVLAIVAYFVFVRGGAPETRDIDVDVKMPEASAPAVPSGT